MTTAVTLFAGPGTLHCGPPYRNGTIQFHDIMDGTIQTLSNTNSPAQESYKGLLFVPSLEPQVDGSCINITAPYIPNNVTRRNDIPFFDHNIIGLAPWVSPECTLAFLAASRRADARALIFYQPESRSTARPPPPGNPVWDLGGNDNNTGSSWKKDNDYPVYAIPGPAGADLMHQLSLYSGDASDDINLVNDTNNFNNNNINETQRLASCTRLYAIFDLEPESSSVPGVWVFVVSILGAIVFMIILAILIIKHVQRRRRRENLRRQVVAGEVNLEYLGLKRLVVPPHILSELPVYVYPDDDEETKDKNGALASVSYSKDEDEDRKQLATSNGVSSNEAQNYAIKQNYNISSSYSHSHSQQSFTTLDSHDDESISAILEEIMPPQLQPPPRALHNLNDNHNNSGGSPHRLTFSQRTCAICLDDFVPGTSLVRELPCTHIFHPECVDKFLMRDGSTCPVCKHSVLPPSFLTDQVSDLIVRREQQIRRLQQRRHHHRGQGGQGRHRSLIHESEIPDLPFLPLPSWRGIFARFHRTSPSPRPRNSDRRNQHRHRHRHRQTIHDRNGNNNHNSQPSSSSDYTEATDPVRREMIQRRAMVLLGTPAPVTEPAPAPLRVPIINQSREHSTL